MLPGFTWYMVQNGQRITNCTVHNVGENDHGIIEFGKPEETNVGLFDTGLKAGCTAVYWFY